MSMKIKRRLIVMSIWIAGVLAFFYTVLVTFSRDTFAVFNSLLLMSVICFFVLSAIFFLHKFEHEDSEHFVKSLWWILFLLYLIELAFLLFFSSEFARDCVGIEGKSYLLNLQLHWTNGTNLIPFKTINSMLLIFQNTHIANSIAITNIFGNIIAFMPFAFFASFLMKNLFKVRNFIICLSFIIIFVEVTQFLTLTGSMDVDDYILNFSGAFVFYLFLKLPFCQKFLRKLMLDHIET